jgi:hypothetical protein
MSRTPELSIQSRPSSARQALAMARVQGRLRYIETLTAQKPAMVAAPRTAAVRSGVRA